MANGESRLVSRFFRILSDDVPVPESVPDANSSGSGQKVSIFCASSEISVMFTIPLAFVLTMEAARRMTFSVGGMGKV
jgi:hypothetical protein